MSISRDLITYHDCEERLEEALGKERGILIVFDAPGRAVRFVQRCHTFRKLLKIDSREIYPPEHPMYGRTPYDLLSLSRKGNEVRIEKLPAAEVKEL